MEDRLQQRGSRAGERGYILALLLGICTVMGIHLQRAIPAAWAEVQRELEAELIYRGEHLAKGIKVFQQRRGVYPSDMEQLMNTRPRFVRKLYKDPITNEGEWIWVLAVQGPKSGDTKGLPVVGFHSSSNKDSFRSYRGKTIYSDWVFSAADNLLGIPGAPQEPAKGDLLKPMPPTDVKNPPK